MSDKEKWLLFISYCPILCGLLKGQGSPIVIPDLEFSL